MKQSTSKPIRLATGKAAAGTAKETGVQGAGVHAGSLSAGSFREAPNPKGFSPLWKTFRGDGEQISGLFHVLAPKPDWQISIHDFTLGSDMVLEFELPEYLSVTWHESISGEEFTPYRKLRAKSLWGFYSGSGSWRGLVHGDIPIKSVSVEVGPHMAKEYLQREYGGKFSLVKDAYESLNHMDDFPEMRALLSSLWPKPGDEARELLYYEGKVLEALGLIVERTKAHPAPAKPSIAEEDRSRILGIASFIDDHCASEHRIADLAHIACMSPTKFKESFKAVTGRTVTGYVQSRRIAQAEQLLRQPGLSIKQVAHIVGYSCPSRFGELFRRETGLLPSEYRDSAIRKQGRYAKRRLHGDERD